ncbi:hypothetical protein R1T40_09880 [Tritonibacter scottomollicae]|uniref:Uncharacterized protein n=1 Tax=Tritonibacter scottomollicae TaxID=483013 RepID=A0ABZ0HK09_TRISK|nr:hypothetical protein [Tritonibacter scottomollicae]WOI35009.1 hypothetical protein R1T40_09880 [Tritonibacter scottomollicae]
MQISFTPTRCDTALTATRQGDVLTLNGEAFDFTALSEGDVLPREAVTCDWLASEATRQNGEIHLTLILPHGADAPEETRFPQPVTLTGDGSVPLPPYEVVQAVTDEAEGEA